MIVCCPACLTRFNVDPVLLGPDGRKVRCAKCAHLWRVGPDGQPAATGQFGLRAPQGRAAESALTGQGEAHTGADARSAPAARESDEDARAPAPEDTSLWARELIEREQQAKHAAGPDEAGGGVAVEPKQDEASGAADMEISAGTAAATDTAAGAAPAPEADQAVPADGAPKQANRRAGRKKGGQTFRMFLLVLCLVVLALFAIAALTGKFGPGGITPSSRAPTVGDVTPPETGDGTADSRPGEAEGGATSGGTQ